MDTDVDVMRDVYMTREQRQAFDRLQQDAQRYRWLRERDPSALLSCAWGASRQACDIGEDPDAAIDAAMRDVG